MSQMESVAWSPRTVLVPLDGSPESESVLPLVARIARPLGLEVVLLRVVPKLTPQVVEGRRAVVVDHTERLVEEAQFYLRTIADRLSGGGLRAVGNVRIGEAPTEIVAAARERNVDLIAMTARGRNWFSRLFSRTVPETVLARTEIPVFVAPARTAEPVRKAA